MGARLGLTDRPFDLGWDLCAVLAGVLGICFAIGLEGVVALPWPPNVGCADAVLVCDNC